MPNTLFYGDNLEVMRRHIKDESVDLCYIDPPFNSNRDYFQIYNNIGAEDQAQAQAFTDTWTWDTHAIEGLNDIFFNANGIYTAQTIELLRGLKAVLKEGALLAYLVSMTQRINEIHRVLKPTGSFYLHCDPTASHYLKLVLDSIFVTQGGDFRNEIIWKRAHTVKGNFGQGSKRFDTNHDTIFFYRKSQESTFNPQFGGYSEKYLAANYKYTEPETGRLYRLISMIGPGGASKGNPQYEVMGVTRFWRYSKAKMQEMINDGLVIQTTPGTVPVRKQYLDEGQGVSAQTIWEDIPGLSAQSAERLGYPTQKPEGLLERIIAASSNEGDVILDAYCGCGTTITVAQRLKRQWIGIDITYQSIGVILKRLIETYGKEVGEQTVLSGIPRDIEAARALANKKDDRVRKEFEKWAVLTYSRHQAIINTKKGADAGIDGVQYFPSGINSDDVGKVVFQVKSGNVGRGDIAKLRGDMAREEAKMAVFLTLETPTEPMRKEAAGAGTWNYPLMGRDYPQIQIVTVEEMLRGSHLELPLVHQVLKKATTKFADEQIALSLDV